MCTSGRAISTFFEVPILGSLFEIAAGMTSPLAPVCAAAAAFASASFVAGVTSGNLALKAGLIAGVTAIANFGIGELTPNRAFGTLP